MANIDVTNNIVCADGLTVEIDQSTLVDYTDITVTASDTRASFWDLKATYYSEGNYHTDPFTVDITTNKGTISFYGADPSKGITLTGVCGYGCEVYNELTNCTAEGLLDKYCVGSNFQVTLKANEGTAFSKEKDKPQLYLSGYELGDKFVDFDFSEGDTTATINHIIDAGTDYIYLQGGAIQAEPVNKGYGSINVYLVTNDALEQFATERFYEQQDSANYINSLKRIFANVESIGNTTISVGNTHTTIQAETPKEQLITLDFGSITIPAHNQNGTDYEGEIKLFLPYYGFVTIPSEYAGKDITLICEIDIITGKGVAKLFYNDVMFDLYNIEPSQDVIYRTVTQQINVINGGNWNTVPLYGTEPYILNKWYQSLNSETGTTQKRVQISDMRGFCVFDVVQPITTPDMLPEEQDMIYSKLQKGVYMV